MSTDVVKNCNLEAWLFLRKINTTPNKIWIICKPVNCLWNGSETAPRNSLHEGGILWSKAHWRSRLFENDIAELGLADLFKWPNKVMMMITMITMMMMMMMMMMMVMVVVDGGGGDGDDGDDGHDDLFHFDKATSHRVLLYVFSSIISAVMSNDAHAKKTNLAFKEPVLHLYTIQTFHQYTWRYLCWTVSRHNVGHGDKHFSSHFFV